MATEGGLAPDPADYRPAWWLPGRHAMTIVPTLLRRPPRVDLRRERIELPDGDFLDLFHGPEFPGAPRVLLVHGLAGSARSKYVIGTMARLAGLGWNATVMEYRGGGPELNRAPRLYHSGETGDLDTVVRRLAGGAAWGAARLYVVGFSLGGNVVAKWLGEQGAAAPVAAAAAVAAPFELEPCARALDAALFGLYTRNFLRTMLPRAREKERQFPGCCDPEAAARAGTMWGYDEHVTAPLHGFAGAADYYRRSSSRPLLGNIRRPTLLLSAEDDPMIPAWTLPAEEAAASPWLHACFTRRGGHLGFVAGPYPARSRYWAEEQTVAFFARSDNLVPESG